MHRQRHLGAPADVSGTGEWVDAGIRVLARKYHDLSIADGGGRGRQDWMFDLCVYGRMEGLFYTNV